MGRVSHRALLAVTINRSRSASGLALSMAIEPVAQINLMVGILDNKLAILVALSILILDIFCLRRMVFCCLMVGIGQILATVWIE